MYQAWMYAIPGGVGKAIHAYDRYKDLRQMQRDYYKNTGRTAKYPTSSYDSRAFAGPANYLTESVVHAGTKAYKTTRSLMNYD